MHILEYAHSSQESHDCWCIEMLKSQVFYCRCNGNKNYLRSQIRVTNPDLANLITIHHCNNHKEEYQLSSIGYKELFLLQHYVELEQESDYSS